MKISIVTVSYNSSDTIADALESVAQQKRCGFELEHIVVDGGSKDGTVEVMRGFEKTHNAQLLPSLSDGYLNVVKVFTAP